MNENSACVNAEFGVCLVKHLMLEWKIHEERVHTLSFMECVHHPLVFIQLLRGASFDDEEWVAATLSRLRDQEELRMLEATFTTTEP